MLLLYSAVAIANRFNPAYEECELEGNCGTLEDLITGLTIFAVISVAVAAVRLISDALAFVVMEAALGYFIFYKFLDEIGIFVGVIAFVGMQMWVWFFWGLSGALLKRE